MLTSCGSGPQRGSDAATTTRIDRAAIFQQALDKYNRQINSETTGHIGEIQPAGSWFRLVSLASPHNCLVSYARDYPDTVLVTAYGPHQWIQLLIPIHGQLARNSFQADNGPLPGTPPRGMRCVIDSTNNNLRVIPGT